MLEYGQSSQGLSAGQGDCVVFLGETLCFYSASLHPGLEMGTGELFMLRKPELSMRSYEPFGLQRLYSTFTPGCSNGHVCSKILCKRLSLYCVVPENIHTPNTEGISDKTPHLSRISIFVKKNKSPFASGITKCIFHTPQPRWKKRN